jgi:hypothetical protein
MTNNTDTTTTPRLTYLDARQYQSWSTGDEATCQQLLGILLERHEWSWHMFDGDDYFRGQDDEFRINEIARKLADRGFAWAHQMLDGARDAHNATVQRLHDEYLARTAGSKFVPAAGTVR